MAFDADPATGVKVYCTADGGWTTGAGTSLGTPCWAGLIALADQDRAASNVPALGNVVQDIYALSASDFHDVTSGNSGNPAKVGYDMATGRGTPKADLIIADLRYAETTPPNYSVTSLRGNTPLAPLPVTTTTTTNNGNSAPITTTGTLKAVLPAMPIADLNSTVSPDTKVRFTPNFAAVDAALEELYGAGPVAKHVGGKTTLL